MSRSIRTTSILLTATLSLALSACSNPATDDPRTGIPLVRAATARTPDITQRSFTGIVSARVQSELGFRVSGKVIERLVDTGQRVTKGQPLMKIDRNDLALAITAQTGAVQAAKARAVQAIADEKRYRGLVAEGAVSASAYDQLRAAAQAAQAQLNAAQAQAGIARNEGDYATLFADADGIVVSTLAEPGQVVRAGQTVVRVAHAGAREATINLPETIRPAIGSTATAELFYAAGVQATARLRQLSDAADPITRTFDARYVLEGEAADSPLGVTVKISLPIAADKNALEVPLAAIFDQGQGPGIWVIEGDTPQVKWRAVQLTTIGAETARLSAGLNAGERFVALGAHLLHDGEQVRIAGAAYAEDTGALPVGAGRTIASNAGASNAGASK